MELISDTALTEDVILGDPYPLWQEIREKRMVRSESGHVLIGGYRDCSALLTDAERFGQPVYPIEGPVFAIMNPPEHGRLRRLVAMAFGPAAIARMHLRARAYAIELLRAVQGQGSMDLVEVLARRLPSLVIQSMIGLTPEERERWSPEWSAAVTEAFSTPALTVDQIERAGPLYARAFEANQHEIAFFRSVIECRRGDGDDLISQLLAAESDGDRLTREELLFTLVLLLEGGENTSINLIGTAFNLLLQHREQFDAAMDDPALLSNAIDEILRFHPVNHVIRRLVRCDTEFAGEKLHKGDLVVAIVAAANRDPEIFEDPDRFDIRRRNANRHLSLGTGIHFCLGSRLVRAEALAAIEAAMAMLPGLRLDGAPVPNGHFNDRGPASLPVRWSIQP